MRRASVSLRPGYGIAGLRSARNHGLGLDLDLPARVEQASDDDHGGRGADVSEDPPVLGADSLGGTQLGKVHPRTDDGGEIGARLDERSLDDLEAPAGLVSRVVGT